MELTQRLTAEEPLLAAAYRDIELDIDKLLITIPRHPLGSGWNLPDTPVLVEIPVGYPTTPPDNICASADLRLANGVTPSNTMGIREVAGSRWLQFSYHIEAADWRPHPQLAKSDTLVTYLAGALRRLEDAS